MVIIGHNFEETWILTFKYYFKVLLR